MTIRKAGIIALLALFALPLAATANQHKDKDGDHSRHMERMADKLELTEDQRAEWTALHENHHPRMKELKQQMREQRKALRSASEGGFDEAAAEAAADRLGDLVAESSLERARMHAQLNDILTEEQQAKVSEYQKKKHGHKGGKHKARHHEGKRKMHKEKDGEEAES